MAAEYAGQPVILIEQDVDHSVGIRSGRWWTAFDGSYVTLPMVMVGSGYQISNGYVDFYSTYKNMIEAEKARPPKANVTAYYQRIGNHFEVTVSVTNQSGVPLSYTNDATVHVIVYEEAKVNITQRFVRAATYTSIGDTLENGETASYNLETEDISPLNWDKVHIIALVDYRPLSTGPYDTLQAAVATEAVGFDVSPDTLVYMVSPGETTIYSTDLTITGAPALTWEVTGATSWLTVSPTQGNIATIPNVSLKNNSLVSGWQEDTLTFTANVDSETLQEQVLVRAYLGPLNRVYLPTIMSAP